MMIPYSTTSGVLTGMGGRGTLSCGAAEAGDGAGAICTGAEPGAPGGGNSGAAEACAGGA
jgi:hypothetical protein